MAVEVVVVVVEEGHGYHYRRQDYCGADYRVFKEWRKTPEGEETPIVETKCKILSVEIFSLLD